MFQILPLNFLNYKSMKNAKTFLVALAIFGLSMMLGQGQTIVYPNDNPSDPGALLQTVLGTANSLAPNGTYGSSSQPNKSDSTSNNSITVNSGTVGGNVFGAVNTVDTQAVVSNNSVIINGGNIGTTGDYRNVFAGYSSRGTVSGNIVTITNGSMSGSAYGGFTDKAGSIVTSNTVNISGGSVVGDIVGGSARWGAGDATNNTVNISGGKAGNQVFGGYSYGPGIVSGNTVNISGGTFSGNIVGGSSNNAAGKAIHNTITISGSPTLTNRYLYGGRDAGDNFTGNTLNVWNYSGSSVGGLQNFEFINFRIPSTHSGAVLTATGTVLLGKDTTSSTIISIEIIGGTLAVGTKITLIEAGTLNTKGFTQTTVVGDYVFALSVEGNKLIAEVMHVPVTKITNVPTTATVGAPLMLTGKVDPGNASYKDIDWSVASAGTTGATIIDNTFFATMPGIAVIMATIKDGKATGEDYTQGFFITVGEETGISEIAVEKISVYPNPTSSELIIKSGDLRVEKVGIFDVTGKTILTSDETAINISHLPSGLYFVKITTATGETVQKIIKE